MKSQDRGRGGRWTDSLPIEDESESRVDEVCDRRRGAAGRDVSFGNHRKGKPRGLTIASFFSSAAKGTRKRKGVSFQDGRDKPKSSDSENSRSWMILDSIESSMQSLVQTTGRR